MGTRHMDHHRGVTSPWMLEVLIEEEGAEALKQILGDFVYLEELDGRPEAD